MDVDATARAMAWASARTIARMAQMLAGDGRLSEPQVEELRLIATDPFDLVQIGNTQLPPHQTELMQRVRNLLDAEWDEACGAARDRGP